MGEFRFVFDSRDHQMLSTVMVWKSAQDLRTAEPDRFARPGMVQLAEQLLDTRAEGFSGVLSMLRAGDEPVAGHFGLRSDRVFAHWIPVYDTRFTSYSPGLAMHRGLAEGAGAAAIHHIDLGTGAEGYKEWFRSRDLVVAQGRVIRGSPTPALNWVRRAPVERIHRAVKLNPSLRGQPGGCAPATGASIQRCAAARPQRYGHKKTRPPACGAWPRQGEACPHIR